MSLFKLAENYFFDIDYITKEEFIKEHNIKDIKSFNSYLKIVEKKYNYDEQLKKLVELLKTYSAIKFENDIDYAIFHKSSKKKNYFQVSFFDNKGAYADLQADSIEGIANKFLDYYINYTLVDVI